MSDLTDDQKKASIARFIANQPKPVYPEYEDKNMLGPDILRPMGKNTEVTKPKTVPDRVLRRGVCFFCNADVTTYARDLPDLEETDEAGVVFVTTMRAAGIIQAHGEILVVPPEEWARITMDVFTEHVGPWLERYHGERKRLQDAVGYLVDWAKRYKLDILSGSAIMLRSHEFPSQTAMYPQTTPAEESEPDPWGTLKLPGGAAVEIRPEPQDSDASPHEAGVDSGPVD